MEVSGGEFFFSLFCGCLIMGPVFFLSCRFSCGFLSENCLRCFNPLTLFELFFFFPGCLGLSHRLACGLPCVFFCFFYSVLLLLFSFCLLSWVLFCSRLYSRDGLRVFVCVLALFRCLGAVSGAGLRWCLCVRCSLPPLSKNNLW